MVTDTQTGSQTEMQHTDPVQYTVLGWVKISCPLPCIYSAKFVHIIKGSPKFGWK